MKYWPSLAVSAGRGVLVPLCGKSLDMRWLEAQGHQVWGVEISRKAIDAYFVEAGEEARFVRARTFMPMLEPGRKSISATICSCRDRMCREWEGCLIAARWWRCRPRSEPSTLITFSASFRTMRLSCWSRLSTTRIRSRDHHSACLKQKCSALWRTLPCRTAGASERRRSAATIQRSGGKRCPAVRLSDRQGAVSLSEQPSQASSNGFLQVGKLQFAYASHGSENNPAIVLIRGLGTQLIDWSPGIPDRRLPMAWVARHHFR